MSKTPSGVASNGPGQSQRNLNGGVTAESEVSHASGSSGVRRAENDDVSTIDGPGTRGAILPPKLGGVMESGSEYALRHAERALEDTHRTAASLRIVISHLRGEIEESRFLSGADRPLHGTAAAGR